MLDQLIKKRIKRAFKGYQLTPPYFLPLLKLVQFSLYYLKLTHKIHKPTFCRTIGIAKIIGEVCKVIESVKDNEIDGFSQELLNLKAKAESKMPKLNQARANITTYEFWNGVIGTFIWGFGDLPFS